MDIEMDNLDGEQEKNRIYEYDINEEMYNEELYSKLIKKYSDHIFNNFQYYNNSPNETQKHYYRTSIQKKLEIINKAEILGNRKTAKIYGIAESSIRYLRKKKNDYLNVSNKDSITTLHPGHKPEIFIDWNLIESFIDNYRNSGIPITCHTILLECVKQIKDNKFTTKEALLQRIYRFLKRNNYTIRGGKYITQTLPNDSFELIESFIKEIRNKRKITLTKSIDENLIINLDETAIFFNMAPKKTIENIGKKQILLGELDQEIMHVSVILAITASGKKLAPLIIFKGSPKSRFFNSLKEVECVKNKLVFIQCNKTGWPTAEIMKCFMFNVIEKYISKHLFDKSQSLIVLDKAPIHTSEEVIKYYKKGNKKLVFIPSGLNPVLQPLEITVNKLFKNGIKYLYIQHMIKNGKAEKLKLKRKDLIQWIFEVWYNESIITSNCIINTFKSTGISNNINGKEDYLIKAYNIAKELMGKVEEEEISNDNIFMPNDSYISIIEEENEGDDEQ